MGKFLVFVEYADGSIHEVEMEARDEYQAMDEVIVAFRVYDLDDENNE